MEETKSNLYTKLGHTNDISNTEANYTKGCQFSPDGLCILTCSSFDHILSLYNTPMVTNKTTSIHAVLTYKEGDCIRDYTWYPNMNSNDPSTCVFLSAAKEQPLHLIDAYTSQLRASYRAHNDKDELISPACCLFSSNGERIVTTSTNPHSRSVFVFHTNLPGNQCDTWNLGKTRKSKDGQKGMISTIANKDSNLYAIGTRNPSSIYLYDDRISTSDVGHVHTFSHWDSTVLLGRGKHYTRKQSTKKQNISESILHSEEDFFSIAKQKWYNQNAKGTGINQLKFGINNHNSHLLYSSARKSNAIVAWDLRMLTNTEKKSCLFQTSTLFPRSCDTNQTLFFDIDDECNRLYVPNFDPNLDYHSIQVFDACTGQIWKDLEMNDLKNVPNGVSIIPNPFITKNKLDNDLDKSTSILAVSFGSRHIEYPYENDNDTNDSNSISNNDLTKHSHTMNGLSFYLTKNA